LKGVFMKVARKVFQHPGGEFRQKTVERTVGWWNKTTITETVEEWYPFSFSEVLTKVQEFVENLSADPQKLINVCEFTTAKDRIGDDGVHWFVVWYWE
jgi:hypothetical protein